jgi:hypothetical protein
MSGIISFKTYLSYALILILTACLFASGQTPDKRIENGQPQSNQKDPVSGHRISGTVTMKTDNQPVAKANIIVRGINKPLRDPQLFARQTVTDGQGRWAVDNVPDGEYQVVIDPAREERSNEAASVPTIKFVAQVQIVEMSGNDINNLVSRVIRGGRISGKVVMSGGETMPQDLLILPEQTIKVGRSPVRFASIQPDGTFILENVPVGEILLRVFVYGKLKEYYMKTATVDGIDLLSDSLNIKDGSEVKDVYIVFAKATDRY